MNLDLRPMSTSQVLDRTFWLYRRNFLLFAGIAAVPPAIFLLGELAIVLVAGASRFQPKTPGSAAALSGAVSAIAILLFLVYFVGYALATGACVYGVSHVYLQKPITILQAYGAVTRRIGSIILMGILFFLAMGGLLFLSSLLVGFVAGALGLLGLGKSVALITVPLFLAEAALFIWIALRMALCIQGCVLEKLGPLTSLKRSFVLARGSVGRMVLLLLLSFVIAVAVTLAFTIPFAVASTAFSGKLAAMFGILTLIGYFVAVTISTPISTIAFSLFYYDQRVRKEAFDLTLMMEAIGQAPPPMQMGAFAGTPGSTGAPSSIG